MTPEDAEFNNADNQLKIPMIASCGSDALRYAFIFMQSCGEFSVFSR
ncbi:MAG: hypothetical protein ABUS47_07740 [Steroidobacter sp.]